MFHFIYCNPFIPKILNIVKKTSQIIGINYVQFLKAIHFVQFFHFNGTNFNEDVR